MKNPLDSVGLTITLGVVFAIVVMVVMPGAEYNDPGLSRWLHIVAGIFWIGLLYYFNVAQIPALAAANADKGGPGGAGIVKYVAPRALLWFRWAAVVTWLTGAWLLGSNFMNAMLLREGSEIIGIGAAPRPEALASLAGDSVATWEGDTLVVVTTNIRPQLAPPGAPTFDQERRVTERFSLLAADRIGYEYVLEDSAMLTGPVRVQYDLLRTDEVIYESACHEGNHSIGGMMLGARLMEQRTSKP